MNPTLGGVALGLLFTMTLWGGLNMAQHKTILAAVVDNGCTSNQPAPPAHKERRETYPYRSFK